MRSDNGKKVSTLLTGQEVLKGQNYSRYIGGEALSEILVASSGTLLQVCQAENQHDEAGRHCDYFEVSIKLCVSDEPEAPDVQLLIETETLSDRRDCLIGFAEVLANTFETELVTVVLTEKPDQYAKAPLVIGRKNVQN